MDLTQFVPSIAAYFHMSASDLLALIALLGMAANVTTRLIPNDATGFLGGVRKIAAVIGLYVPSRITSGVTVTDAATAAYNTPPIGSKADAIAAATPAKDPTNA